MEFFNDLADVCRAGKFYHGILRCPAGRAWRFFLLLVLLLTIITATVAFLKISGLTSEAIVFFRDKIKTVKLIDGRIANMPVTHKTLHFKAWTIEVDRDYTGENEVRNKAAGNFEKHIFIGQRKAFVSLGNRLIPIEYPRDFTDVINADRLKSYRFYLVAGSCLSIFVAFFLYKLVFGLLYTLLVIVPIIMFKFRRQGLPFSGAFKAGLYLASFQVVFSTVSLLLGIFVLWDILVYILFYIFYIGAVVNINIPAAAGMGNKLAGKR